MRLLGQLVRSIQAWASGASEKRRLCQGEEVHRTTTSATTHMEQVCHALCRSVEGTGGSSIMIKVWTGSVWSWIKVRITGREIPDGVEMGSPQLIRKGNQWWLHTPIEKQFKSPGKIEKQITTNEQTKICSVDLNIEEHLAVCTIRTVEGSILATKFIGGGRRVNGLRKKQLGRIARNRRKTGIIAEGEQDNADLWRKIRNTDEQLPIW